MAALVAVVSVSTATATATPAGLADWQVRPGVEAVTVTGAEPGQPLTLYRGGRRLVTMVADEAGAAHFAYVAAEHVTLEAGTDEIPEVEGGDVVRPGRYRIRDDSAEPRLRTRRFEVLGRDDVPDASLYDR